MVDDIKISTFALIALTIPTTIMKKVDLINMVDHINMMDNMVDMGEARWSMTSRLQPLP